MTDEVVSGLDPRDPGSFERIEQIIARIGPDWSGEANLLGIRPVLKVSSGRVNPDSLVIGFYVTDKVAPDELAERGFRPVPTSVDGIPTDVVLARQRAHGSVDEKNTRSQMFDTLVGGIAVGNADLNAYGTLTMTLLAQSDGRMVGLTNEHVLVFDGDGQIGDEVQQPRFYLNSEVSLDSAACCPNGVLHYRGVDNPIVDAAAAVFAAAVIAAAASDEIDPHRRGQDATVPDPSERTLRETVSMSIDYPRIPLPGTPYPLGVDWKYSRQTDRRVLDHAVSEEKRNPHVIDIQHLVTDRRQYPRGAVVELLAVLGPERERERCDRYFVTAAALSPSHRRAHKVILRPFDFARDGQSRVAITYGEAGHSVQDQWLRHCYGYDHFKIGEELSGPRLIDGITYDPGHSIARFVAASGGGIALLIPRHGLTITLPRASARVTLSVELNASEPISAVAYAGDERVDEARSVAESVPTSVDLALAGEGIDRIVLKGAGEASLRSVCAEADVARACFYRGRMTLAPDAELGLWSTYVFAQTTNDVRLGTDPLVAATTIGGLPITSNFADGGESDHILYGQACNVDLVPDGSFEVITEPIVG